MILQNVTRVASAVLQILAEKVGVTHTGTKSNNMTTVAYTAKNLTSVVIKFARLFSGKHVHLISLMHRVLPVKKFCTSRFICICKIVTFITGIEGLFDWQQ